MRALFEIALKKGWPVVAGRLLLLSKMVERRLWNFVSGLRQFDRLTADILDKLDRLNLNVDKLRELDAKEIGLDLYLLCY